jgi:hypothetical protein
VPPLPGALSLAAHARTRQGLWWGWRVATGTGCPWPCRPPETRWRRFVGLPLRLMFSGLSRSGRFLCSGAFRVSVPAAPRVEDACSVVLAAIPRDSRTVGRRTAPSRLETVSTPAGAVEKTLRARPRQRLTDEPANRAAAKPSSRRDLWSYAGERRACVAGVRTPRKIVKSPAPCLRRWWRWARTSCR